MYRGL